MFKLTIGVNNREKGNGIVGTLGMLEIDYKGDFAKTVRKTHHNLITEIERKVGEDLPDKIGKRIKRGNNLAYLSFEGEISGKNSKFIYWAHSAINGKSKKTETFNELFSIYYCTPNDSPKINSGSVNEKNDTITFNNDVEKDFEGNAIYNRNNDSESKLIEKFLEKVGKSKVEGELFIYTTLGPCLSCEKKIATLVSKYFCDMDKLNVNVWYCTDYSNKNFA